MAIIKIFFIFDTQRYIKPIHPTHPIAANTGFNIIVWTKRLLPMN